MNYTTFAADNARAEFTNRRGTKTSHWIDFDAPKIGRHTVRAACGALVDEDTFSTEPSCEDCRKAQADIDGMKFE